MSIVQVPRARLWTQPLPANNQTEEKVQGIEDEEKNDKSHLTTLSAPLPSYVNKTTVPSQTTMKIHWKTTSQIKTVYETTLHTKTTKKENLEPTKMWSMEISTQPTNAKRSKIPARPITMAGKIVSSTSDDDTSAIQPLYEDSLFQESNLIPKRPDLEQGSFWSNDVRDGWVWKESELPASSREERSVIKRA